MVPEKLWATHPAKMTTPSRRGSVWPGPVTPAAGQGKEKTEWLEWSADVRVGWRVEAGPLPPPSKRARSDSGVLAWAPYAGSSWAFCSALFPPEVAGILVFCKGDMGAGQGHARAKQVSPHTQRSD